MQGISHKGRKRRAKKARKRRERDLKELEKRRVDGETYDRVAYNRDHELAFLLPVPLYYGYGYPSGIPPGPDGRCGGVSPCLLYITFLLDCRGPSRVCVEAGRPVGAVRHWGVEVVEVGAGGVEDVEDAVSVLSHLGDTLH